MPTKVKKKRASLKLDPKSGQIKHTEDIKEAIIDEEKPPVRQIVEVVEDSAVPEAIETIKKDTEEIEKAVESIEEEVGQAHADEEKENIDGADQTREEVAEVSKGNVESLFLKSEPVINPEIVVVGKNGPPLGVWVGAMLGVALAIGVSLIFLVRGPATLPFLGVKSTPTLTPTVVPTSSPIVVNRSDIKVQVLNGGGTPGAGSKMRTFLEDKGYSVVSVGNTEKYSYEQTEILVKSGKDNAFKLLTEDLKADYSLGTSSASVKEGADYDAQVIVGKEE